MPSGLHRHATPPRDNLIWTECAPRVREEGAKARGKTALDALDALPLQGKRWRMAF